MGSGERVSRKGAGEYGPSEDTHVDVVHVHLLRCDGRVVLFRRSGDPDYWGPVSGMVEHGEGTAGAAARELAEETCLKLMRSDIVHTGVIFPALSPGGRRPLRIHVLAAFLPPSFRSRTVRLNEELNDAKIVDFSSAKKLLAVNGTRESLNGLQFLIKAKTWEQVRPAFLNRSERIGSARPYVNIKKGGPYGWKTQAVAIGQ